MMLLRHRIEHTARQGPTWHRFGEWITAAGAAMAFAVWLTVHAHPEQDLPLWPAWIFTAIGCIGLGITFATSVHHHGGPRQTK
jgi:hypothetical protein